MCRVQDFHSWASRREVSVQRAASLLSSLSIGPPIASCDQVWWTTGKSQLAVPAVSFQIQRSSAVSHSFSLCHYAIFNIHRSFLTGFDNMPAACHQPCQTMEVLRWPQNKISTDRPNMLSAFHISLSCLSLAFFFYLNTNLGPRARHFKQPALSGKDPVSENTCRRHNLNDFGWKSRRWCPMYGRTGKIQKYDRTQS